MKRSLALAALLLLAAAASRAQSGIEVGITLGPTWALGGDSFIVDPRDPGFQQPNSFKDDFDTGWSFGGWASGHVSGMIGWRGELVRDSMPADADEAAGRFEGDYHLTRFQGGVQIEDFESTAPGQPYAFVTIGLVHEDASIEGEGVKLDFDGRSAFGMSFGGGYKYRIGEKWGVGADLHINSGAFDDETRWWWTPTAQVFYRF